MSLLCLIIPLMRIGSCAGRRVALLNRAASIDRCVVCNKAALLIVSFPVASSLTCCMHQQMHMFALFRQVHLRSIEPRHSQGMCPIRLAAGLSCLSACLLDQACWFPLLPLNHHLVVFCIHKCISCELCVQMPPRRQIFSRFLVLCFLLTVWTLIRGGKLPRRLAFELPSHVMDLRHSSRLMCVSQRLYPSFKPIVVDIRFILVQRYLCLQTQNSEETTRSVSLAYSTVQYI